MNIATTYPTHAIPCLLHRLYLQCSTSAAEFADNFTHDESTVCTQDINDSATSILEEYGNDILRLAYSYLHNMSDAEDIVQDTLIQFLKTNPKTHSPQHKKAWLLRVAINLSKNKINYNNIRQTDELADHLVASNREDLAFLWDCVKRLPPKYRKCIHLYYYEGYSTIELSSLLQLKESTVRSTLKRGREKLKILLKEDFNFEA